MQASCCAKSVSFPYWESVTRHEPGEQSIPARCLSSWQQPGRTDVEDCLQWVTVQTPLGPSYWERSVLGSTALSLISAEEWPTPGCSDRLENHNLCGCSANRATEAKGDTAGVSFRELTEVCFPSCKEPRLFAGCLLCLRANEEPNMVFHFGLTSIGTSHRCLSLKLVCLKQLLFPPVFERLFLPKQSSGLWSAVFVRLFLS